MKKIVFLFLLVSTFGFSQEDDYSKIFSNFDSIQKGSFQSHINRIVNLIIYDYAKQKKEKSSEILIITKIDSLGKLNLVHTKESTQNKDIKKSIIALYKKIPPFFIEGMQNQTFTLYLTLENNIDIPKWREDLFSKKENNINNFNSLEKIPSFKNSTIQETDPIKNFNTNILTHIKKNFRYPSYALKNNISGQVTIYFIIEKEGNIKTIICYDSHPSLQLESISIIKKLPQFNPGYINNEPVQVSFSLPLTFKLQ
ncbi:energy transducer TonB [Flavobacterium sediminilitoris]|uniref:Energy transducer TonB n=1 Tax=Flavobacterium sediminilitoris TaxID=2024526 RepID=A0ABY4HT26_9FLAO|nr:MULTISPECIES: energy transducer TonB [Flavobacterium]UOX35462.1 energy transducer TonB [Flavobacterium sediminilitoris]